mmetsp:Transcript_59943/g.119026  ORF Transcript_59943/g.119026 Transcript_59943/m.119026 type:complete len:85 (+) Transcript_59943:7-261(+)
MGRQVGVLMSGLQAERMLTAAEVSTVRAWAAGVALYRLAPTLLQRLAFDALVCWDTMEVTHLINAARTKDDIMRQVLRDYGGCE